MNKTKANIFFSIKSANANDTHVANNAKNAVLCTIKLHGNQELRAKDFIAKNAIVTDMQLLVDTIRMWPSRNFLWIFAENTEEGVCV